MTVEEKAYEIGNPDEKSPILVSTNYALDYFIVSAAIEEAAMPAFRQLSEGRLFVRGDTLVKDLNEWLDLYLPSEEVDTIGGLILSECRQVPRLKEEVKIQEVLFQVEAMDGKGVTGVSVEVTPEQVRRLKDVRL